MTLPDFPNTFPVLTLDFRNSRQLDPRITFTRASAAGVIAEANGTVASQLQQFPENVPQLTQQGLTIDSQSTNLLLHSVGLDGGKWASQFATNNQNTWQTGVAGEAAPDGTVGSVASMTSTNTAATNTYRSYYSNSSGLSQTAWTFSCFLKANGINTVALTVDGAWNQGRTVFTLTGEGTATSQNANTTATITPIGSGWYRCSTSVVLNQIRADCMIAVDTPGDSTSGIFVWGAQLEELPGPTSYIRTAAQAGGVTRAADVASITGADFTSFYNQSEGTLVMTQQGSGPPFGAYLQGGNTNTRIIAYQDDTTPTYVAAIPGTTLLNGTSGTDIDMAEEHTIAAAIADQDFALAQDGAVTITSPQNPPNGVPAVTQMFIGRNGVPEFTNGPIASISYYPIRVSNDELEALTA